MKVNEAAVLLQMGDIEVTLAVNNGLTVTVEFPVTLLVQVPSLTETKFTVWLAVTLGTLNTKEPDALSVTTPGVPFKV